MKDDKKERNSGRGDEKPANKNMCEYKEDDKHSTRNSKPIRANMKFMKIQ